MKRVVTGHLLQGVLGFCLLVPNALAQNEAVDWYQVAAGGGASSGGAYSLTGTIGQSGAFAVLSGGAYVLSGGFWSLASAQNTNAPALFIEDDGGNLILHWQAQTGWVLQENHDLGDAAAWTNSFGLVTVNGVSFHGVANPPAALFFRLKREN